MNLHHRHAWLLMSPAVSSQGGMFPDLREQQKLSLPTFLKERYKGKIMNLRYIVCTCTVGHWSRPLVDSGLYMYATVKIHKYRYHHKLIFKANGLL